MVLLPIDGRLPHFWPDCFFFGFFAPHSTNGRSSPTPLYFLSSFPIYSPTAANPPSIFSSGFSLPSPPFFFLLTALPPLHLTGRTPLHFLPIFLLSFSIFFPYFLYYYYYYFKKLNPSPPPPPGHRPVATGEPLPVGDLLPISSVSHYYYYYYYYCSFYSI